MILARNYNVFVVDMDSVRPSDRSRIGAKSASGVPGPKSAPRGSKSTTLSKGICQPFEHRNTFLIHIKTDFEIYASSFIHVSQHMLSWSLSLSTKRSKSGSCAPGPQGASTGSKPITFSKGICQPFELRNSSLIQYVRNLWFQHRGL